MLVMLAQAARCDAALLTARQHVVRLDPARAEIELTAPGREGCDLELALAYLRGLSAAKAAYAQGGDEASLAPVRAAIALAGERAALGEVAEIVGFVLRAAVAAAQSERDEMSVMLAQALQVERSRGARGLAGRRWSAPTRWRGTCGCRYTATTRPRRPITSPAPPPGIRRARPSAWRARWPA